MICGCVSRARPQTLKFNKMNLQNITAFQLEKMLLLSRRCPAPTMLLLCRLCPAPTVTTAESAVSCSESSAAVSCVQSTSMGMSRVRVWLCPAPNHRLHPKHHLRPTCGYESALSLTVPIITCVPQRRGCVLLHFGYVER